MNQNRISRLAVGAVRGKARECRELGLDSLLAGEPASGLWHLRNAIELDSDDPETWQLLGRCFEELGQRTRARNCFLLALRQDAAASTKPGIRPSDPIPLIWRRRPSRDV